MQEKNNIVKKKVLVGVVISTKMEKTAVVEVERTFRHPVVGKVMYSKKRYKVHDENSVLKDGYTIEFYEGRPISKTKYTYLHRIIKTNENEKGIKE